MAGPWRVEVRFIEGPATNCSDLFAYLRSSQSSSDASAEPPCKRRRVATTSTIREDIDESDAVLLASRELSLQFPSTRSKSAIESGSVDMKITALHVDAKETAIVTIVPTQQHREKIQALRLELGRPASDVLAHLRELSSLPSSLPSKTAVAWSRCTLACDSKSNNRILLRTHIFLAPERSWTDAGQAKGLDSLLQKYLPTSSEPTTSRWTPQDFYENVHVPLTSDELPACLQEMELECKLYPFQQRAVRWMVSREGAMAQDGQLVTPPDVQRADQGLPPSFRIVQDAREEECYVSDVHRVIIRNKWSLLDYHSELKGGILAEEMGLGKTVELIALTTLHKQPAHLYGKQLNGWTQSPSTLIITPAHILEQWLNEIATHAPHLKVLHYKGLSSQYSDNGPENPGYRQGRRDYTVAQLMEYDIVLTSYSVLAREIHFAEKPPDRDMRHALKYKRRRSPLVLTKWWRVCLDEAQLIESGVSQAATVARQIPRTNAWAVSGTPLKKNIEDLRGLLIFLGYEPFATSRKSWQRIDKTTLRQIFGTIALRHNKHKVAHELRLPPQKRVVITMPFTTIEEQNYDQLYKLMCRALGVSHDGSPTVDNWNPDNYIESMRSWLKRLRETCLHPQVGSQNKKALGRGVGPLRTVNEVLETMIEQNHSELRTQERAMVIAQVMRGQIVNNDKSNTSRSEDALALYKDALSKTEVMVQNCRDELAAEEAKVKEAKAAKKQQYVEDSDSEDEENLKGRGKKSRLAGLKKQLRSALEALHICVFYVATSYYQIKENEKTLQETEDTEEFRRLEALEIENYDRAKVIRKELLLPAQKEAHEAMSKIAALQRPGYGTASILKIPVLENQGGIENRKLLDKFDMLSDVMDAQAELINEWRTKIIKTLTGRLVDTEDDQEITGEEYKDSTKLQDELYIYVSVLRAVISDRQQCISGEANHLMKVDLKEAITKAKYAIADAKKGIDISPDVIHSSEFLLDVVARREKIQIKPEEGSMQAIISEARSLASTLGMSSASSRAIVEASIIDSQIDEMRKITSSQREIVKTLEKELGLFHSCMNERVEYYRQLQELSDMVAPWKEELDEKLDHVALELQMAAEESHTERLATLKTKQRFLLHLRAESSQQSEARICVICTDPFENGVLTVCGHQYCKDCITAWWRSHRTCPECRRVLTRNDVHDITYRPQQLKAIEEQNDISGSAASSPSRETNTKASRSTSSSIYSSMSVATMNEIKSIELEGSFGTKIDTICRHLIWLRENDPGAKSIIFSQYNDFLEVLASALRHFKISGVSIREPKGVEKFRRDPSKECFLLDAKSDSSGLNLVSATHVFLCEPLVNAAIELQAIARVHRIGQMRETTVYMYLINDTVEEAIYEISVNRRLAHIGKASGSETTSRTVSRAQTPAVLQETALDKANNLEMQQAPISTLLAKGKNDGELVDRGDLWNCLFGKPRQSSGGVSGALQMEVDRHVRAEAAEDRIVAEESVQ